MDIERLTTAEFARLLRSPFADSELAGVAAVIVDDAGSVPDGLDPGTLPVVIIGTGCDASDGPPVFDVIAGGQALDSVVATVEQFPLASVAYAVLLRSSSGDVEGGLAGESAVYSLLQAGPEFARWRGTNTRAPGGEEREPAVIASRQGDVLTIELNRPQRHNAFSRSMRDALCEALALAVSDDGIARVDLRGRGPSFCSGGDLGEFGLFPDPATAHRTRLLRSPARLMHRLADRVHVRLHGACMGAGIELPAFAGAVSADPTTRIALPELSLGLVPGAGGTVSLPRRVGRQRTAWLGLSGQAIDAATALDWRLIDEIVDIAAPA